MKIPFPNYLPTRITTADNSNGTDDAYSNDSDSTSYNYLEHYPRDCILSGLSQIVHLLHSLATCLYISLPHPIYVDSMSIAPQYARDTLYNIYPYISIFTDEERRDFDWSIEHDNNENKSHMLNERNDNCPNNDFYNTVASDNTNTEANNTTLVRASGSCVNNNNDHVGNNHNNSNSYYIENPHYEESLSLLQANICSLCIHCGLSVDELYPPSAMLYNLDLLNTYIIKRIEELQPEVDDIKYKAYFNVVDNQGNIIDHEIVQSIRMHYSYERLKQRYHHITATNIKHNNITYDQYDNDQNEDIDVNNEDEWHLVENVFASYKDI
jgi:hypothetical protein